MENERAHLCGDPFSACDAECMDKAMMTEAERSNYYQAQMRTWRTAALESSAERDQLRAEVEAALTASGVNAKAWQDCVEESAIKRTQLMKEIGLAEQRAEASERERDEAQAQARHWREAAVTENERAMEYLNAVAEAQAHAAWFKKVPA